jgi:exopolysaccharide biosynthesis predicted pyruvyltransferase EpsI
MGIETHRAVLHEFLKGYRGRDVVYFPNPGNAGDALIGAGTKAAFDRAGLSPGVAAVGDDVAGKVVIMGGGGSLLGPEGEFPSALAYFAPRAAELIVLPHTIRANEEFLSVLQKNATLFVRDISSFNHLLNTCDKPSVVIAPDMAFHLDARVFLDDSNIKVPGEKWFGAMLKHRGIQFNPLKTAPRAYFARTDWEKKDTIGGSDFDVSEVFAFGVWGDRGAAAAWCLLNAVDQVRAVTSDRLHVGIASALLGKECEMHDNIYGKNKGVFEYSLKYFFRNVRLVS